MAGRRQAGLVAALIGVALLIAGCGSSSSSKASSAASSGSAGAVAIATAKGPVGTYLTDGDGRSLYLWAGDGAGKSNCSGNCATSWPPLTTGGTPIGIWWREGRGPRHDHAVGRQQAGDVHGAPALLLRERCGAGSANGQGSDNFGAKWWLVAPSGAAVTTVPPRAGY